MRKISCKSKIFYILIDYFKTIIKSKTPIVVKYIMKEKKYIIIIEIKEK